MPYNWDNDDEDADPLDDFGFSSPQLVLEADQFDVLNTLSVAFDGDIQVSCDSHDRNLTVINGDRTIYSVNQFMILCMRKLRDVMPDFKRLCPYM